MVLVLENIVRTAGKIARTAQMEPLVITALGLVSATTGIVVGATIEDGLTLSDTMTLIASSGPAMANVFAIYIIKKEYERIRGIIDEYGFHNIIIGNKRERRYAKVYAQEQNLMDPYNSALERYST